MQYRVHGSNTITTRPEPLIREMLRMHLDLYHHYAAELKASPIMRQRFYEYSHALWENMSSGHAGMLQVMLAQLAQSATPDQLEALAASLPGPEFEVAPNRTLAGAYDGQEPLSAAVLSRKIDQLRLEQDQLKTDRAALDGLSLACAPNSAPSRWVALGRRAGGRQVAHPQRRQQSHAEKLAKLQQHCAHSRWLQLGARLGVKTAQRCLG
jgi:hypothetical protein